VGIVVDHDLVLLGAALHDAGKTIHVQEMTGPGHRHEAAGERLLIAHGIPAELARFCVTHAAWDDDARTVEDLLVALADKLWKGKREEGLEQRAVVRIAGLTRRAPWEVFAAFDAICEAIAADGPDRLERSRV
jgi:hypothetical protein